MIMSQFIALKEKNLNKLFPGVPLHSLDFRGRIHKQAIAKNFDQTVLLEVKKLAGK